MSDIVDRLRNPMMMVAADTNGGGSGRAVLCDEQVRADMNEAATEIETLRAQLASIRQVAGAVSLESGLTFNQIKADKRTLFVDPTQHEQTK